MQVYENTLVYENILTKDVLSIINASSFIRNFKELYKDEDYTLSVFDSNGDVDYYDESKDLINLCLVKESVFLDEPEIETFCKQGYKLPFTVSYLIESGFLFKNIQSKQRDSLIKAIAYSSSGELREC